MLLALSIPAERHAELEGLIGLRSGALKRWQKLLHDLDLILHHLEGLHLQLPNIECTIGEALINSTLVHWLILEQRKPDIVPLLQWWIETGRHRTRSLTGKDLLAMGTPAGPMISDLLRIAQHAAWLGGDTDAERAAVLEHLSSTS